MSYFGVMLSRW